MNLETWKPSEGFIACGPEPVDGATDDDEGGIDIRCAGAVLDIDTSELMLDVDIAAALDAWTPDDWHAVHSRPVGDLPEKHFDRFHTFMFSHSTLAPLVAQPDAALVAKCLDDSGVMPLGQ